MSRVDPEVRYRLPVFLSAAEAAVALAVSPGTIYAACRSGDLESFSPGGKSIRISRWALLRYAQRQERSAAEQRRQALDEVQQTASRRATSPRAGPT